VEQVTGDDGISQLVNFIRAKQGRTGEEVWIREHKDLTAELERGEKSHLSLLTTSKGKAFDSD
jgi:hypothetical protein